MKTGWFLLLVFFSLPAWGQKASPMPATDFAGNVTNDFLGASTVYPSYKYSPYWKKHKTLKALGWTSIGIGVPAMAGGLFYWAIASYESTNPKKDERAAKLIMSTGLVLSFASIPLFVCAHDNKMRAISLSVGCGNTAVPTQNGSIRQQPALAFRVCF